MTLSYINDHTLICNEDVDFRNVYRRFLLTYPKIKVHTSKKNSNIILMTESSKRVACDWKDHWLYSLVDDKHSNSLTLPT